MVVDIFEGSRIKINLLGIQIVWDPDKKRWTNTEGGEEEPESFKPPPKMSDLMPNHQPMPQQQIPTMPTQAPQAPTVPMMEQNSIPSAVPTLSNGPAMTTPQQPDKPNAEPAPTPRLQSNMYKMQRNRSESTLNYLINFCILKLFFQPLKNHT